MSNEAAGHDPARTRAAWAAATALVANVDPMVTEEVAGRRADPVASLRECSVEMADEIVRIEMTYQALASTKKASLAITVRAADLIAEHAADFQSEGYESDSLFECWEVFEHTVNWAGLTDEHFSYDRT